MSAKIGRRPVRDAAAQLEIDRAIVARRLGGKSTQPTIVGLPLVELSTLSSAHHAIGHRLARNATAKPRNA